jgi:hypothetical protein
MIKCTHGYRHPKNCPVCGDGSRWTGHVKRAGHGAWAKPPADLPDRIRAVWKFALEQAKGDGAVLLTILSIPLAGATRVLGLPDLEMAAQVGIATLEVDHHYDQLINVEGVAELKMVTAAKARGGGGLT